LTHRHRRAAYGQREGAFLLAAQGAVSLSRRRAPRVVILGAGGAAARVSGGSTFLTESQRHH